MKNPEFLTLRKLNHQFSIFFFSTTFLILVVVIPQLFSGVKLGTYFAQGFFALFFFGYSYLAGRILEYYLIKTIDRFKKNYPHYKLWYWLFVGLLALGCLITLGYYVLERQSFWGIVISTSLVAVLGLIGWILKKIYEKHFKKSHYDKTRKN